MAEDIKTMTAEIVCAYVAEHKVSTSELVELLSSVFMSLSTLDQPKPEPEPDKTKATSLEIRKSIKPDALISFEDGKAYKTLKRHLSRRGLTVEAYKAKWGLPSDYPMTAASYSATRSAMAKSLGLGSLRQPAAKAESALTVQKATRTKRAKASKA